MVSFGVTRFLCFAVIVALASGMIPLPSDKDEESTSLSDESPISKKWRTCLEKSLCSNKLENVRDKMCDLEITGTRNTPLSVTDFSLIN